MLHPRIIPCLLVKNKGLVKTVKFSKPKYVGDPINAVRIFNEKEVDELFVLDIDATVEKRDPDMNMIKNLAAECRMPLCYGGGVNTSDQIQKIVSLGVEKVALSAAALEQPQLITKAAKSVGSQSLVVVIDVKRRLLNGKYEVRAHNGHTKTGKTPVEFAQQIEMLGAGEIVINSIDKDGIMEGYDLPLIKKIKEAVHVPITALGGAGSLNDIENLFFECGVSGAAAGSLFVFKGAYKAVLINYPNKAQKDEIFERHLARNKAEMVL